MKKFTDEQYGLLAEKAFNSFTQKLMFPMPYYDIAQNKYTFSEDWYDLCLAEIKEEHGLMKPENRAALALFGIKIAFSTIIVSKSQEEPVKINP